MYNFTSHTSHTSYTSFTSYKSCTSCTSYKSFTSNASHTSCTSNTSYTSHTSNTCFTVTQVKQVIHVLQLLQFKVFVKSSFNELWESKIGRTQRPLQTRFLYPPSFSVRPFYRNSGLFQSKNKWNSNISNVLFNRTNVRMNNWRKIYFSSLVIFCWKLNSESLFNLLLAIWCYWFLEKDESFQREVSIQIAFNNYEKMNIIEKKF